MYRSISGPVKFAVIGSGHIGKRHAEMVRRHPEAQLVAMCDILPPETTGADAFQVPCFTNAEEMFASGIEIDVVNVCSPNGLHAEHALIALENFKHVVCEKPMALNKADCEKIIFKALQAHKNVFCVMQNRYSPPSQWLKSIVQDQILGEIFMVQLTCYWNRDDRYYKKGNWKGTADLDGGTLFTQFSHFIDIMYWIFGDIVDIQAKFDDFTHEHSTAFEDSGFVNFRFNNGGMGCINYTTAVWDSNMESSISVVGSKGSVKIGGQYMNEVEYCHIDNYSMPKLDPVSPANDYGAYKGSAANHHFIIENVIDTLKGRTSITTNALEGLKVVEIIERIYALRNLKKSKINSMYQDIISKKKKIAVIGLGYVGLPIALEFARKVSVIGFDINKGRVDLMKNGIDPSGELDAEAFVGCDIVFTDSLDELKEASFFIVAVPTPIDEHNLPDLKPILSASRTIGKVLKKGDYVVYESTVYPGCTEEDCIPVLEEVSGLKFMEDFKIGYSPERINPGDKEHTLAKIMKVVSGCSPESLEEIAKTYQIVVQAGVHKASSIKVAEAAKIIENTQRDVNIALMNELSIIFNKMGINTYEVLEAAGTKWNFLKFMPGLVGGHCIGVDPYYLTYKAQELGYHAQVINSGRYVNDSMGFYVAKQTVKKLIALGKDINKSRVLVMGATFKEDVEDIRNSKVADVINEFKSYGVKTEVTDPHADSKELHHEYGFELVEKIGAGYDAVVIAVNHKEYLNVDEKYLLTICNPDAVIVDLKGILRGKIHQLKYWSL